MVRRCVRVAVALALAVCVAAPGAAQERAITLAAPPELSETGFLKFVLPRFALKNSIRVTVVPPGDPAAHVALSAEAGAGRPVFTGLGATYGLAVAEAGEGNDFVDRFTKWLRSDSGMRAVTGFQIDGTAAFGPPEAKTVEIVAIEVDGDAQVGAKLSLSMCGRCHVVGDINRLDGIGSTPSFMVLRTFSDWENRFSGFYALKPHGAFTQIEDVTPPFDPERPPAIAPIEMSLEDLENIVAFVAGITPADLGAPIEHQ